MPANKTYRNLEKVRVLFKNSNLFNNVFAGSVLFVGIIITPLGRFSARAGVVPFFVF